MQNRQTPSSMFTNHNILCSIRSVVKKKKTSCLYYILKIRWSRLEQWPTFVRDIYLFVFPPSSRLWSSTGENKTNSTWNMTCIMFFTEPIRRPWRSPNQQQRCTRDKSVIILSVFSPSDESLGDGKWSRWEKKPRKIFRRPRVHFNSRTDRHRRRSRDI